MRKKIIWLVVILGALLGLLLAPLPFGEKTRIQTAIEITKPIDVVFEYVTTPAHWPQWHPASLRVSAGADHSLTVGEQVREDFRVAGRRGSATWTVRQREVPSRWVIEGQSDQGGGATITYTLSSLPNGARFERELVYGAPSLLFVFLNRFSLRAQMMAESGAALHRLKQVLEAS